MTDAPSYRYYLSREWSFGDGAVTWVMLNPSTADEAIDDPTITRVTRRSQDAGYAALHVVNLFAARATKPKDLTAILRSGADPCGPLNDGAIRSLIVGARDVVYAWGASTPAPLHHLMWQQIGRVELHCNTARIDPLCLGLTHGGHPRHPLYVAMRNGFQPYPLHRRLTYVERRSNALAVLDQSVCPNDGTALETDGMDEPALFIHGGYGATRRTVVMFCRTCSWSITREISEVSPRTTGGRSA